ncbi:gene transfer agent family protein [Defluviimonas aestuarii]|uniref:gene transfer agent family protein n=1 Tax=Albidovulum aestuarii TaxID=1130726 RepID=UPI00249C5DBF|nr:gene transfer agent family protein [Defluviimonas aestuarii]MDI3335864.1 gene transfer agent family protein [Defluviimonas aestuarii]
MSSRVELTWIGGDHAFALGLGQLRAVQKACDAGPMEVLTALRTGTYRVDYPLSVLRYGLIGGGMPDAEARTLMDTLGDAHPLGKFVMTAAIVLAAAIVGVEDDPVGEGMGELSPPENGSSAGSTPMEQRPDSPQGTSTP